MSVSNQLAFLFAGVAFATPAKRVADRVRGIDAASRRWVPDFPFKPDSYFAFGWMLLAGALGCSILACMLGAFWPARAAARLEPTEALTS